MKRNSSIRKKGPQGRWSWKITLGQINPYTVYLFKNICMLENEELATFSMKKRSQTDLAEHWDNELEFILVINSLVNQ